MGDMAIAALSVGMHQQQAQQDLGVAVLKMAMDTETEMAAELVEGAAVALDPNLGNTVDISA